MYIYIYIPLSLDIHWLHIYFFLLKWTNLKNMDRNGTKICPGQKFVTNEYPGIYSEVYVQGFP